jgi:hypothetical protein
MFIPPALKPANVFDILGPDRFRCSCCLKVNRKAWSDEKCLAEAEEFHNTKIKGPVDLLCDDCYDVALLMIRLAERQATKAQRRAS